MAKTKKRTIETVQQDIQSIRQAIAELERGSQQAQQTIAQNWRNPDESAAMQAVMLERRKTGAQQELATLEQELHDLQKQQVLEDYAEAVRHFDKQVSLVAQAENALKQAQLALTNAVQAKSSASGYVDTHQVKLRQYGYSDSELAAMRRDARQVPVAAE